ncbi:MAG: sugar-transfer associated ATP-grasp domain-containing protein [Anaerolineae bacterium]
MWRPYNLLFLAYYVIKTDYHVLFQSMRWVHQHHHKSYLGLAVDMLGCTVRYAASFSDYMDYRFFQLDGAARSGYANSGIMHHFYAKMNHKQYKNRFRDKSAFYKHFNQWMGRQCLFLRECTAEEFTRWISTRPLVVAKPHAGGQGIGVEFVDTTTRAPQELYSTLLHKGQDFIEEPIQQHDSLHKLNPTSLNTLRVVTVYTADQVDILCTSLKLGIGTSRVDNMHAGGIAAPVDTDSGQVYGAALSSSVWCNGYVVHPNTQEPIVGFRVPYWNSVLELARTAARIVSQVRSVGWDIAVTNQGPILVEGNGGWGVGLWQIPEGKGRLEELKRYTDL